MPGTGASVLMRVHIKILTCLAFLNSAAMAEGDKPLKVLIPLSPNYTPVQVDPNLVGGVWSPGTTRVKGKLVYRTVPTTNIKFISNQANGSILATIAQIRPSPTLRNYVAKDKSGDILLYIPPKTAAKYFGKVGGTPAYGNWVISGKLGTQDGSRILQVYYLAKRR